MNVHEAVIYREGLESEIREYLTQRFHEFNIFTGLNIESIYIDLVTIYPNENLITDEPGTDRFKKEIIVHSVNLGAKP